MRIKLSKKCFHKIGQVVWSDPPSISLPLLIIGFSLLEHKELFPPIHLGVKYPTRLSSNHTLLPITNLWVIVQIGENSNVLDFFVYAKPL